MSFRLESTGLPGMDALEGNMQRALDQVRARTDTLAGQPYAAAAPADWSGSPPRTVGEALDRIAAALGPIA
jgi:hypothetical protein